MATFKEYALQFGESCVQVPPARSGVCLVCHGSPGGTWTRCWSCKKVWEQLSHPCDIVVPVSLCRKTTPPDRRETAEGLQFYDWLKRYKSAYDAQTRQAFGARLAVILGWFLENHWACLAEAAGAAPDVMTVVPSTREDRAVHPLQNALQILPRFPVPLEPLLTRGQATLAHNQASDQGYVPIGDVAGRTVLIIEDLYVTGSRAQSAASALARAGAKVAAVVPIGRLIDPDYGDNRPYWDRQVAIPFSFDLCCLENW